MAFKDFFKKKKEPEKKKKEKKPSPVSAVAKKAIKSKKEVRPVKSREIDVKKSKEPKKTRKKVDEGLAYRVLKAPHITEKATDLAKNNRYVFRVYEKSNKTEIRKAVEKLYDVDVLSVKIIKVGPKKRIFKGMEGERKGYKKAVVEIRKGQGIEIFSK